MIDRIGIQPKTNSTISNSVQETTTEKNTTEPIQSNQNLQNQQEQIKISKEKLEKVVDGLNHFVNASNTHLQFKLHEKLNEYYVTIVDDKTQEVIKEIPSKKLLDTYAEMKHFLGLLVDKKI